MTLRLRGLLGGVVLALTISMCAACGAATKGPDMDALRAEIAEAVVNDNSGVTGVIVNVASANASSRTVRLKVYADNVEEGPLVELVDGSLRAAWTAASFEPAHIAISVVDGVEPSDAIFGPIDGVDLGAVAEAFELDPRLSIAQDVLTVRASALTARYGAWQSNG